MDVQRLRTFLLTLPHAVETMQWGDNLVFWVGDKGLGGKMFALINLDPPGADTGPFHDILSYAAGPERYSELLELDGIVPAPYFARIHWVAAHHFEAFSDAGWRAELTRAHALTHAKLPRKVLAALTLPAAEQRRLIREASAKKRSA